MMIGDKVDWSSCIISIMEKGLELGEEIGYCKGCGVPFIISSKYENDICIACSQARRSMNGGRYNCLYGPTGPRKEK
jgi:hypothetical protein